MTTTVTTSTAVVGTVAAQYLPELTITCNASNLKPSTTYYPFFGGVNVSQYCAPTTSTVLGTALVSDAAGTLSLTFDVPANVFASGTTVLQLRDTLSDPSSLPTGASYSYANATFEGTGTVTEYQTTITTTVTNVVVEDPLAQQFFTYGVTGGCYLTKIDVYFFTSDSVLPVTCELRTMTNGYPSSTMVNQYAKATLYPSGTTSSYGQSIATLSTASDASVASTFTFPQPIYLEEDKEYCFVLKSASNQYQVWTATVGQKSQETGLTIIQPTYTGSMFKSQNNLTWVATPNENIKFTIYQASFNTSVQADLEFYATPVEVSVMGQYLVTTSGSPLITYNCPVHHNMTVGSYITINGQVGATYNGIPAASLAGDYQIVTVLNDYSVQFNAGASATSSGQITSSGIVNGYSITNSGSSYSSSTLPTITISGGGGTGATATCTVKNGSIYTVTITNPGTGYTSAPTATITSTAGGSGGVIVLRVDPVFSVIQNMQVNSANPLLNLYTPTGTSISSNIATTDCAYSGGSLVSYTLNTEVGITPNKFNSYARNSMIAAPANEKNLMSNTPSSQVNVLLNSTNSNVSPAIDVTTIPPVLQAAYYNVNGQGTEETSGYGIGTQATGYIGRINVISGGTGYTAAPTVTITSTDGNGSGATATANLGGVTTITISNGGSGYTTPPTVTFSSGAAAGYAQITNGAVTAIYLTNTGSAYSSAPTISFSGGGGTGAAATCVVAASTVVSGITITNAGTGYTSTPTVTLTATTGSGATATAILVPFNTELNATGGNAAARFVTESMQLSSASTGLRVYSTLYSSATSSVDVYARSTLASSGTNIGAVNWVQMRCSVTRNQSKSKSDFFEYVFTLDNLSSFDTFQLKFVLRASNPNDPPIITKYSAISLA